MRALLDTNVYVSAAISTNGVCATLLREQRAGRFDMIVSPKLLAEIWVVLERDWCRRFLTIDAARAFVASIPDHAEQHSDPVDVPAVTRDPKDDYLIALAHQARVDVLVSGDDDLTPDTSHGVAVLTPGAFLRSLSA